MLAYYFVLLNILLIFSKPINLLFIMLHFQQIY